MLREARCPTWLTPLGLDRGCLSANLPVWLAVGKGAGAQGICTSIGQRETDPAAKVPLRPPLTPTVCNAGESPAPASRGLQPAPPPLTFSVASVVSAFPNQSGWCLSYPQLGAPSPLLGSPTMPTSGLNPKLCLSFTHISFGLSWAPFDR